MALSDTIAALEERLKQAKAKQQKINARKRSVEQKRKRQDDTRRKILVGAIILAKVERGEWPELKLRELLDKALTRTDERALFDLQPIAHEAASPKEIVDGQQGKKESSPSENSKATPPAFAQPAPTPKATAKASFAVKPDTRDI